MPIASRARTSPSRVEAKLRRRHHSPGISFLNLVSHSSRSRRCRFPERMARTILVFLYDSLSREDIELICRLIASS
jgi:hypothetical protein